MKIKVLRTLGKGFPEQLQEGQEATVDDAFGKHLVERGLAESLDSPSRATTVQAVPPKSEIQSDKDSKKSK